jgi:hypothetical protein
MRDRQEIGKITFSSDDTEPPPKNFHVPYSLIVFPFSERDLRPPVERDVARFVEDLGQLLISAAPLLGRAPLPRQERPRVDGDPLPDGPRIDRDGIPPNARFVNYEGGCVNPGSGKTLYGATFVFFFHRASNACNGYNVIQINKVRAEKRTGDGPWEDAGTGHDWDVDGERSDTNPTSRDNRKAKDSVPGWPDDLPDARVFSDTPGSPENPWENEDARGKTFRWTYDFETYIICQDPQQVIGYFTWGFTLEVTVGDSKETTSAKISDEPARNKPTWHPGAQDGHLREGLNRWNADKGPPAADGLGLPPSGN